MDATALATLWVFIALLLFVGILVYMGVHKRVATGLDARSDRIRKELDEARGLREEAQKLLEEYQRKRKDAEAEAAGIIDAAKREAEAFLVDAKAKTEDYVSRRTVQAEQKIAQAERDAVGEVRGSAVDIAVEAARKLLSERGGTIGPSLFKDSVSAVKAKMN